MNVKKYGRFFLRACLLLLPAVAKAQNLVIQSGGWIQSRGTVHLVLHNAGLINNSRFRSEDNSTIHFTGEKPVIIGGTPSMGFDNGYSYFNNVVIDKAPGNMVQLYHKLSVSNVLYMRKGNLLLNEYILNLWDKGRIDGENDRAYITGGYGGKISAERYTSGPAAALNLGNMGMEITTPANLGPITIERSHVQVAPPNGEVSVKRVFNVAAAATTGKVPLSATLRMYYLDAELDGNSETQLLLWGKFNLFTDWTLLGKNSSNMVNNYVEKKNITNLSGRFTLATLESSSVMSSAVAKEESIPSIKAAVYPNPVTSSFTLTITGNKERDIQLSLYDQSGRLLQQKQVRFKAGTSNIVWDMSNYITGIYLLKDDAGTIRTKIIKR